MDIGVVVPQATATVPIEIVVQVRAGEGQEWPREVQLVFISVISPGGWLFTSLRALTCFLILHCVKKSRHGLL